MGEGCSVSPRFDLRAARLMSLGRLSLHHNFAGENCENET